MIPLRSDPSRAPRHKLRGKRHYFRNVRARAEAFRLDLAPGHWWNAWHYHADWPGWGNGSWRYRLEHLRALAVVFRHAYDARARFPVPFQTWLALPEDAGQDAVYVHTPNPHSEFPMIQTGATWGVRDLDATLALVLPGIRLRVGRCTFAAPDDDGRVRTTTTYLVYSPDAGVSLE